MGLGVDQLLFRSPEDDDDSTITDGWEESEAIQENGFSLTITPMKPIEHYLGSRYQTPPAACAEVTPRRTDKAHSPAYIQHPHRPQFSPGFFDRDGGVKRVVIGGVIISVVALLMAV